jgi:glycosyltransferase involved in cell wall biosynthesis
VRVLGLRILYVSAERVPGSDGGSVHTRAVAEGLARRGHEVTLLTRQEPGLPAEAKMDGVRVLRAPMRFAGRTVPLLASLKALRLRPGAYDVVMARFSALGGAEALFASRSGLPLVLEVNSPQTAEAAWRHGLEGSAAGSLLGAWGEALFARAAAVITPSARIVPEAARPRCRLVDWACDTDRFRPAEPGAAEEARRRLALAGRFVVAFAGSFRPGHGADLLLAAAEALRSEPVSFLLVGDGPERAGIEAEAARRGVGGMFRFTGRVPPEEVPGLLAAAHAGAAPFRVTGWPPFDRYGFFYSPLKIFEYMASGLPVLTTACPELSRIVREGETGLLLPGGDAGALAGAVRSLAGASARRESMGAAGCRDAGERFSWGVHVAALEGILEEVAGAGRP